MERLTFETDKYYHVYNRGVDKRTIFLKERDYLRFASVIYYFNDENFNPENFHYQGLTLIEGKRRRELVDIVAWCLMPNHYHFLLRQKVDGGITKFMRRVGTGYTMFFNTKYERSGSLFEGPFKARAIDRDDYLLHATRYIHLNPLSLFESGWKEKGVSDKNGAQEFILQYPWSSLPNFLGKRKFSEIIALEEFWNIFEGRSREYRKFLWEWLPIGVQAPFDLIKV